jgi:hypothetical protein
LAVGTLVENLTQIAYPIHSWNKHSKPGSFADLLANPIGTEALELLDAQSEKFVFDFFVSNTRDGKICQKKVAVAPFFFNEAFGFCELLRNV